MYQLPELEISDVPIRINNNCTVDFCRQEEANAYADFTVTIKASSDEDWDFTEIWMGATELPFASPAYNWAASHFSVIWSDEIHEHIGKHLQDAKDDAAYDDWEFSYGYAS